MLKETRPANMAVLRSHYIVKVLAGAYLTGLSNKDITSSLKKAGLPTTPVNTSRDLSTLEALGYARSLDNGLWTLQAGALKPLQAYSSHMQDMQFKMAESNRAIFGNYKGA